MEQTMQILNKILILSVLILTNTTACTTMAIGGAGHHGRSNMHSSADADIINRVNHALVNDSHISATDIRVSSRNGVVTLNGTVVSHEVADKAIHLARSVSGVEAVKSELHVRKK